MDIKACAAGFCCADVYQNIGVFYPTGNGIDWGIHLARMGVSVSAVSVVGKDEYGDKMREALAAEGFDISHLRVEDGDTSVMLMALKDGVDRVHLEAIDGVMETYRPNEDDRAFILEHDIIHTDLFGNCLDLLPEWHDAGKTVVMDFSVFSQDPEYACENHFPYVDYAFMSFEEDTPELRDWVRHVQELGPRVAVATLGEKGSIAYDGERFYECGIVPAEKVVNTVGAGDSYIAGLSQFDSACRVTFNSPASSSCVIPNCVRR